MQRSGVPDEVRSWRWLEPACAIQADAYLSGWISILKESPKVLLKVLSDARKAADLITEAG